MAPRPDPPAPPPDARLPTVFLRADALAAGIPEHRLRRAHLVRIGHGAYRNTEASPVRWKDVGLPEPSHGVDGHRLWALLRHRPDAVLSHATAAHLHGLPTPWGPPGVPPPVDVTVPADAHRLRLPGVRARRRPLPAQHVVLLHGLRVTSLERTVVDLGSLPAAWTFADVVAAADHAVRHPWSPGRRRAPATTPGLLWTVLADLGPFHGVRTARDALGRMRVGADSAYETFLRLALEDAGLPEPVLQAQPRPVTGCPEVDLYFPTADLALQYDGGSHLTPDQQARDARRDSWLLARGCRTVRVSRADHGQGYRRVIQVLEDLL